MENDNRMKQEKNGKYLHIKFDLGCYIFFTN